MNTEQKLGFVLVGPQRTATSWLDTCLRAHPDLSFPSDVKETFYWDNYFDRSIDWYWSHFNRANASVVHGEVGSTYFHCDQLPRRLREHNPQCRIVITVRHPRDRATSLLRHLRRVGKVAHNKSLPYDIEPLFSTHFYESNLTRWYSVFPEQQILVLVTEELESQPNKALDVLAEFLGVSREKIPVLPNKVNEGVEARHQALSNILYRIARVARKYRLHRLVELVKKLGIRKLVTTKVQRGKPSQVRHQVVYPIEKYESDILFVEELLGRKLDLWRSVK